MLRPRFGLLSKCPDTSIDNRLRQTQQEARTHLRHFERGTQNTSIIFGLEKRERQRDDHDV